MNETLRSVCEPSCTRSGLTTREISVLAAMADGLSNAGIGARLCLSAKTVEAHVGSVFAKLGLQPGELGNRRVQAVLVWLRETTNPSPYLCSSREYRVFPDPPTAFARSD